jgi:hypothetical protein
MKTFHFSRIHPLVMLKFCLMMLVFGACSAVGAERRVPSEYATIQAAVNESANGDTILIAAGNYSEQALITGKTLTLRGEAGTVLRAFGDMTAIIPGTPTRPLLGIVRAQVTLEGIIFDGGRLGDTYPGQLFGIVFRGSGGRVDSCTIRGFRGSTAVDSRGINVINRVSVGSGTIDITVVNNVFADNDLSVGFAGDDLDNPALQRTRFTVRGNWFTGLGPSVINTWGVMVLTGASGEIRGNTFQSYAYSGNDSAFAAAIVAQDNWSASRGKYHPLQEVRVIENVFDRNDHHIFMIQGNESQIVSNSFVGINSGVRQWGGVALSGTNIVVSHNEFLRMPTGIELLGGDRNTNGILRGVAVNTKIIANHFCEVDEPVRIQTMAVNTQEEGASYCPRELLVPSKYATIQAAVDASANGDTIRIAAGDYYEQALVTNRTGLTIVGEPGTVLHSYENPLMLATVPGAITKPLLAAVQSQVAIRNITFDGHGLGDLYANLLYGVVFREAGGRIEGCTFRNFTGSVYSDLRGISVVNHYTGANSYPPVSVEIVRNSFTNNINSLVLIGDAPLGFDSVRISFRVESNNFEGMGASELPARGIWVRNGAAGQIQNNVIGNHRYVGSVAGYAAGVAAVENRPQRFRLIQPVSVSSNRFATNDHHVVFVGGADAIVKGNVFEGSGEAPHWGAVTLAGTNLVVVNNNFSDHGSGVFILSDNDFFAAWPGIPRSVNPRVIGNWFCNVNEAVRIGEGVDLVVEEGSATCPFAPILSTLQAPLVNLRGWHTWNAVIEASTDLVNWGPVHTNSVASPLVGYWDAQDGQDAQRFYRAVVTGR